MLTYLLRRPLLLMGIATFVWAAGLAVGILTGNPTFSALSLLLVASSAWCYRVWGGLIAAVLVNVIMIAVMSWAMPDDSAHSALQSTPFGLLPVLFSEAVFAVLMSRFRRMYDTLVATEQALRLKNSALEAALTEVRELRDLLPMCAWCKSIRGEDGYWQRVEGYLSQRTGAKFSHGICPKCLETAEEKAAGPPAKAG
jgi:hypothetical protein